MDITFQIGEPVVFSPTQINVEIKLVGDNTPVFQGLETNDPFTVTLAAGNYVMYSNLDNDEGCITQTCFTIPEEATTCACPTLRDVAWGPNSNGIYYLTGIATMPDGIPPCGLQITWTASDNSTSTSVTYTTASQFASVSGDEYSFQIYLGGADGYSINFLSNCCNDRFMKCGDYSFSKQNDASGGTCYSSYTIIIVKQSDGLYYFKIEVGSASGAPPYADLVINYGQANVNPSDSDMGTMTVSMPNAAAPFDVIAPTPLNPSMNIINPNWGGVDGIVYSATTEPIGCNGETFENSILYYG